MSRAAHGGLARVDRTRVSVVAERRCTAEARAVAADVVGRARITIVALCAVREEHACMRSQLARVVCAVVVVVAVRVGLATSSLDWHILARTGEGGADVVGARIPIVAR